jgi:hypothetical protein
MRKTRGALIQRRSKNFDKNPTKLNFFFTYLELRLDFAMTSIFHFFIIFIFKFEIY